MNTEEPAQPQTLLERRKAQMGREIREVALDLFDKRGYDEVAVADIAAAAGVSPRTFFRYFAGKDDIILDYQRRVDRRLVQVLQARPESEGAATALRNAYVVTSQVRPEDHEAVLARGRVLRAAPVLRARARGERGENLRELAEIVAVRMDISPSRDQRPMVLVAAMSAVAVAVWDDWVVSGHPQEPSRAIGTALDQVIAGFSAWDEIRPAVSRAATRKETP